MMRKRARTVDVHEELLRSCESVDTRLELVDFEGGGDKGDKRGLHAAKSPRRRRLRSCEENEVDKRRDER